MLSEVDQVEKQSKRTMAARKNRISHDQKTRDKIKTSQLINRLTNHALGETKPDGSDLMSQSQVNAARILINKTLPDLSNITHEGSGEDGEFVFKWQQ